MSKFEEISLEKGMYETGKTLSEVLEAIDPSENYRGTALEGLDAFSRQLKRFNIKVSGRESDIVEKFFYNYQTSILFPEFVRRCVEAGMDENTTVKDIVAVTTKIDGLDYRAIKAEESNYTVAGINNLEIKINNDLCRIHRRGRCLETSYESLRFQRISILSVVLRQIGHHIRKMQLFDAVDVLEKAPCRDKKTEKYGYIAENDIHQMAEWLSCNGGFDLDVLICSADSIPILKRQFGDLITYQFGDLYLNQIKIIPIIDYFSHLIIGIDSDFALEMVECDSIHVDYEKLLDKQFERAAIYCQTGFNLLHPKAVELRRW